MDGAGDESGVRRRQSPLFIRSESGDWRRRTPDAMTMLATHTAPARLIAIGDIHGCYDELVDLLARVDPSPRASRSTSSS